MGKIGQFSRFVLVGAFFCLTAQAARADYVISLVNGGALLDTDTPGAGDLKGVAAPGDTVTLDLFFDGDTQANNRHDSLVLNLTFKTAGLILTNYSFTAPYFAGSAQDSSDPRVGAPPAGIRSLPAVLGLGASGINFSINTAPNTVFIGEGVVASIDLLVPAGFDTVTNKVLINVVPSTIADFSTFTFPGVQAGPAFSLNIVPEPATLTLLGLGGLVALRRRRRKA